MTNKYSTVRTACIVAGLFALSTGRSQTLFSDDFQANSSPDWNIFAINGAGGTTAYTAQFAFDYSTQEYRFNGVTNHVPPAPNSSGTTKGLKLTVNKSGTPSVAAVSLYPKLQSFSGNFALKFDLWTDYSGDIPYGDGGSTEFAAFGIDHAGTNVNWPAATQNGDGHWFSISADGGSGTDYRAFVGDSTPGPNLELLGLDGGFLDRDGDLTPEQNNPDSSTFSPFQLMYPAPPGQSLGAIGKQWVQVEVRQQDNVVTWLVNGYIIAQHPNAFPAGHTFTSGNIMLGHQDPYFAELPDEPWENYSIFDNVRVVDLTTNTPLPVVSITAADSTATESGGDTGLFTLTRTGSTASPLTVSLRVTGTAANGTDYATNNGTITFAAGADTTNITVTPINDATGEQPETVIVTVIGNVNSYDVLLPYAIVTINDDNDVPNATLTALRPSAYENSHAGLFKITFSNPNASDTTVHFSTGGTAVNGVDYTNVGSTIVIPAGSTNARVTIMPVNNSARGGDKTVSLTLTPSSGYAVGSASNATEILYDDDFAQGGPLFADDFETNSSTLYTLNRSQTDGTATFVFNYGPMGIPPAPHTTGNTTLGLKLQANDTNALASGMTVSPIGKSFTGDYRLRFDMWINYNGPLDVGGSQSTEFLSAGIGTKGIATVWSLGGSGNDGVWISLDGDSGNGRDLRIWKANTEVTAASNPGVYPAGSQNAQNTAYYYFFGSDFAPLQQQTDFPSDQFKESLPGNPGFAWHDVMLTKIGSNVTWVIDGVKIAGIDASGTVLSTNVFVGFYDPTAGKSPNPDLAFGLVDNLRVYTMQAPVITSIQTIGSNVQIDFTASTADSPSGFTLQKTASVLTAPTDTSATMSQLSPGVFRAVTAASGSAQYYRVRR